MDRREGQAGAAGGSSSSSWCPRMSPGTTHQSTKYCSRSASDLAKQEPTRSRPREHGRTVAAGTLCWLASLSSGCEAVAAPTARGGHGGTGQGLAGGGGGGQEAVANLVGDGETATRRD